MLKSFLGALAVLISLGGMTTLADAQATYKVKPGDTLLLEVLEDSSLNRSLLVLPDGNITVPQGGTIHAAGKSVDEVRAGVTAALAPNFATTPTVWLSVGQLAPRVTGGGSGTARSNTVAVYALGEVAKPGRVDIEPGTTLLQFLAESGGLTNFAATKRIQLRRVDAAGQEQVYMYNYQAVKTGGRAPTIVLQKGDVIVVPQRHLFE